MSADKSLKNKSAEELASALAEKRTALEKFRFAIAGSKTRNVREGRAIGKEIARIITELNSRGSD